jgi:hypothetical protein
MLTGKLFQIGYTPRSSVAAGAPERPARPDPRPRARERDAAAAEVRQAEARRPRSGGRQNRNAGMRSVVIEA